MSQVFKQRFSFGVTQRLLYKLLLKYSAINGKSIKITATNRLSCQAVYEMQLFKILLDMLFFIPTR